MAKSFNEQMKDRFAVITSDVNKANVYIHETAMMIIRHAHKHGDCSTAQGLVMAMPASMRREMLILWFKSFTPIIVKNDAKWTAKMHKEGTSLYVPWDIEGAEAKPFYEMANENKERPPLGLADLLKIPGAAAKSLQRRIENGEIEEEEVATALALVAQLEAIKVQVIRPAPLNENDKSPQNVTEMPKPVEKAA